MDLYILTYTLTFIWTVEALCNSVLWKVLYKFIVIINNNNIIIQLPLILFFDDQPLPNIDTCINVGHVSLYSF